MNRRTSRSLWQAAVCALLVAAAIGCGNKGSDASGNESPKPGGGASAPGVTPDISGSYTVKGTNPDGSAYTGSLQVTKRDQVVQLSWKVGGSSYDGVGVQTDDTLGVAFSSGTDGKGCSVVHYKVDQNGALLGRWGQWGANASGTESIARSGGAATLDGTYDVTGTRLDGKSYKGSVTITTQGAGFLFNWTTPDTSQGFGIRDGSFVSVGIGGEQCGFVSYKVKPDGTLDGKWSSFKSRAVGTETATRNR